MGYRTIIARYVAKWGIARMCLCKVKYQGEVSHHFVGALTSLKKYRAIWGYRSDGIAVSRDMGPLSLRAFPGIPLESTGGYKASSRASFSFQAGRPKPPSVALGRVQVLGNVPSATTTTESLIWWIIRCYI